MTKIFDAVVVGGGPAGATAANDLARAGHSVLLIDRAGRIKPCGGAIPPRLIADFLIPESLLVARATSARMVSPKDVRVDIPINDGFVGMVDREHFDEWLRERAGAGGATRVNGRFECLSRSADDICIVNYTDADGAPQQVQTRAVIGADGARSKVGEQAVPSAADARCVFAYHEIVATPEDRPADFLASRCEVHYHGITSPDFYGWVFPHGGTVSIGTGSADKGFSQRQAVSRLREKVGLQNARVIRREGAPLPMRPLKRWDNGRDVVLAGDAAGVVAPASGEGIYYAMVGGRVAASAVQALLQTGDGRVLRQARKAFMKEHGRVFWVLGIMQRFWYRSDRLRERFVAICRDPDVQTLTFDAYMNKRLVRKRPMAHVRIFFKDIAHLLGLVRV